jgi:hypothetical protein
MKTKLSATASAVLVCAAILVSSSTVNAGPFTIFRVFDVQPGPAGNVHTATMQQAMGNSANRMPNRHGMDDMMMNQDMGHEPGQHHHRRHHGPR